MRAESIRNLKIATDEGEFCVNDYDDDWDYEWDFDLTFLEAGARCPKCNSFIVIGGSHFPPECPEWLLAEIHGT